MKDLSKVDNSMTFIIQNNHEVFDTCSSIPELLNALKTTFKEYNLDTPASRRLIANVGKKPNFAFALQTVYNSMLFASNLAVDQK